jgi:hypothetical protein
MNKACNLHESYYTIQVKQKGFEDWNALKAGYPTYSNLKAYSLEEAENLLAKINYDCNVRIIHFTKEIVETRKITKGTPLDRKALYDLIQDMPVLSVAAGIFYKVVGIETCRYDSHSHHRCETFTLRDMKTHAALVCVFDGAAIVGDKLKVFTRDGAEVQFNVLKPVKLN